MYIIKLYVNCKENGRDQSQGPQLSWQELFPCSTREVSTQFRQMGKGYLSYTLLHTLIGKMRMNLCQYVVGVGGDGPCHRGRINAIAT